MTEFRTGNGVDIHRFSTQAEEGNVVVLGGIDIPHEFSLLAHSDGDVLTHALIDAMLGALALGDLGCHFPDSDPKYKNIRSLELLKNVVKIIAEQNWCLVNADITVVAQAPKLSSYVHAIRERLAATLVTDIGRISVKATTSEGLGFTGRQEGIAVFATVLLGKD